MNTNCKFLVEEIKIYLPTYLPTYLPKNCFQRDALDKADTPLKKLNSEWLQSRNRDLEDGLVDLGAAAKDLLQKAEASALKKRNFKGECKNLVWSYY